MSDPFAIRLDFLALLRRLTASQQSIHRILTFAARNASAAADDIWDCIVAECSKASLNARLNILFLVDSLLSSHGGSDVVVAASLPVYVPMIQRDLLKLVRHVAPATRDGMRLNAGSVQRLLDSWRAKRTLDLPLVDEVQRDMEARRAELENAPSTSRTDDLSRAEVLRRIEEDRERHKLLREGRWILPPKSYIHAVPGPSRSSLDAPLGARSVAAAAAAASAGAKRPASTASANPSPSKKARVAAAHATAASRKDALAPPSASVGPPFSSSLASTQPSAPDAHEVEFEALWEATSDLNDDDLERIREEDGQWWGGEAYLEEVERNRLERERAEAEEVERIAREKERVAAEAAALQAAAAAALPASTPSGPGARRRGFDHRIPPDGPGSRGGPPSAPPAGPAGGASSWSSSPATPQAGIPTGPRHHGGGAGGGGGGAGGRIAGFRPISSSSPSSYSPHSGPPQGQSSSPFAHSGSGGQGGPQTPHHALHAHSQHQQLHQQHQQQRDMTPPTGPSARNWAHHPQGVAGAVVGGGGGFSSAAAAARRRGTPPTGPRWGGR